MAVDIQRYDRINYIAGQITGANINHNDSADLGSQLAFGGLMVGAPLALTAGKKVLWDAPKWAWQNRGNYTSAWAIAKANRQAGKDAYNALHSQLQGKHLWNTANNFSRWNELLRLESAATMPAQNYNRLLGMSNKVKYVLSGKDKSKAKELIRKKQIQRAWKNRNAINKAKCYEEARNLINEAKAKKMSGAELKAQLKKIREAMAKGDLALHNAQVSGAIKPLTKRGKALAGLKKYSGYNKAKGAVLKGCTSSSKSIRFASKGVKCLKGSGPMALIGLAMETPELIETYKTCGTAKGNKQLAKTSAVVAAETVGYAVGAKLGAIAGAKGGALVGTFIGGPIGTAIGGVVGSLIGVAGGLLVSYAAGYGVKSMFGKSELQKHKEEQKEELVEQAMNDKEKRKELLQDFANYVEENGCNDQKALQSFQEIAEEIENEEKEKNENRSAFFEKNEIGKSALVQQLESFTDFTSSLQTKKNIFATP